MAHLSVRNFSCIHTADLDLSTLTILIGPQASGKSVISKLVYFFYDLIMDQSSAIEEDKNIEDFTRLIDEEFRKSFPPQAWGSSRFVIKFSAGPFEFSLERFKPKKSSSGKLRITLSPPFVHEYSRQTEELRIAREKGKSDKEQSLFHPAWELAWEVRRAHLRRLEETLGADYLGSQLFIPAGRSFFTSMGKTVVAFEQGGFLDPLTIRFGRYFLAMRDRASGRHFVYRSEPPNKEMETLKEGLGLRMFGGKIKMDKNEEYVEASDGRKIPFAFLSSGQQELLPLWLALNEFSDDFNESSIVYIEEPEAHLFPTAQSILVDYLATIVQRSKKRRMLITTHSPYVLSKLNNLLKAGSLGASAPKSKQGQLEAIIPRRSWLRPGSVAAYALIEERLVRLMSEDGLIDGEYLDDVSGDIARDFSGLLEFETAA